MSPYRRYWPKLHEFLSDSINQALGNRLFQALDGIHQAALATLDQLSTPDLFKQF
jgi:hypothetical protein